MIKLIQLEIKDTCVGCPFKQYDSDYGRSYDSGYDCNHPDVKSRNRIANDGAISNYNDAKYRSDQSVMTLFPEPLTMQDPLTIPSWCPLPTV